MISYILYFEIGDKIDGWNLIYIIVYLNVVEYMYMVFLLIIIL